MVIRQIGLCLFQIQSIFCKPCSIHINKTIVSLIKCLIRFFTFRIIVNTTVSIYKSILCHTLNLFYNTTCTCHITFNSRTSIIIYCYFCYFTAYSKMIVIITIDFFHTLICKVAAA